MPPKVRTAVVPTRGMSGGRVKQGGSPLSPADTYVDTCMSPLRVMSFSMLSGSAPSLGTRSDGKTILSLKDPKRRTALKYQDLRDCEKILVTPSL